MSIIKIIKIIVAILATAVLGISLWILTPPIGCHDDPNDEGRELINKIRDPYIFISRKKIRGYLEGLKELSKKVKEVADPPSIESE